MVTKISTQLAMKSSQYCRGFPMGRGKRGRPRGAALRRKRAFEASDRLSEVLNEPWNHSTGTVFSASKQVWEIGKRHRIGLPPRIRVWMCRSCHNLLRPGVTARVRIRNGCRYTTCLNCGKIAKRGPNFKHEVRE